MADFTLTTYILQDKKRPAHYLKAEDVVAGTGIYTDSFTNAAIFRNRERAAREAIQRGCNLRKVYISLAPDSVDPYKILEEAAAENPDEPPAGWPYESGIGGI